MNVDGIPAPQFWFPIAVSVVVMALAAFILRKKQKCYNSYNCMPRGHPAAGFFLCEEVFFVKEKNGRILVDMAEIAEAARTLRAGDKILLSGVVYTARDAAHKRFSALLDEEKSCPSR